VLVIPAFSVMRTHMLWNFVYNLNKDQRLPNNMIFYSSSPMADQVARIILKHTEDLDDIAKLSFSNSDYNPFKFDQLVFHRDYKKQTAPLFTNDSLKPFGVIASSGMCEFGRIVNVLEQTISDPKNIILLTGYAARGTRAARMQNGEKMIPFYEKELPLNAEVRKLGGLSGHADKNEIIAHLKHINTNFKGIFIKHGEKESCYALQAEIIKAGYKPETVHVMKKGQTYEL